MRNQKSDRGQSLVEFALVLPMLLVVCIGMAELGRITWAWNVAQQAAAEGARRAIVIGDGGWKDTAIVAARRLISPVDGTTPGMMAKTVITPTLDTSTTPKTIQVTVAIPIKLLLTTFWATNGAKPDFTLTGRSKMDCQPAFHE
jgi:Flp pilus assembly protein TadG